TKPYPIIDHGLQTINYQIVPHKGDWKEAGILRLAWELNEPAFGHLEFSHPGKLGTSSEFMKVNRDNVLASVLKKPEDEKGIVVRVYETCGKKTEFELFLPYFSKSWKLKINPCEIKTFLIESHKNWEIKEVNLLEEK
ncbi:MAG: glycosyl hydrolase-related protein, partial [Planctomycetota bacterium]